MTVYRLCEGATLCRLVISHPSNWSKASPCDRIKVEQEWDFSRPWLSGSLLKRCWMISFIHAAIGRTIPIDRTRPISFFRVTTSLTSRCGAAFPNEKRKKEEEEAKRKRAEREENMMVDRVDDCLASGRWIFKRSNGEASVRSFSARSEPRMRGFIWQAKFCSLWNYVW